MKRLTALILVSFTTNPVFANQILVLSGGGTPLTNHYSQYLQTKTLFDDLKERFPQTESTVLFGGGNQPGVVPTMGDVHRLVKLDGLDYESLIFGEIKGNSAASPENVEKYFAQDKLSKMRKNETLYLFVSDHGMPFINDQGDFDLSYDNNCIDLFGYGADLKSGDVTIMDDRQRCLARKDLQSKLESKVSAGRVLFAMSQCYSGGFHKMSVSLEGLYPKANSRICGFTAVPEDTTSSGCTADVDGPNYQGYERYFTQQLTGLDIVSGERLRPARTSMKEAHEQATLEDNTKDIPLSTSDYYLWKWALAMGKKGFVPRTKVLGTQAALNVLESLRIGAHAVNDPLYLAKEKFITEAKAAIIKLHPELEPRINGSLTELAEVVAAMGQALEAQQAMLMQVENSVDSLTTVLVKHWSDVIRRGKSSLSEEDQDVEKVVFADTTTEDAALITMSVKAVTDPKRSEAISNYKARRIKLAMEWALKTRRKELASLVSRIKQNTKKLEQGNSIYDFNEKMHGHLRRILIYRQALGAWAALDKMKDKQALSELKGLLECERTTF
jgi:hypothetical protein